MHAIGKRLGDRSVPARLAATLTIVVGLTSLAGWVLDIPSLTSVIPGAVEMKANTAGALVLAAVALLILADRPSPAMQRLAEGLGVAVFAIGAATVAEYWAGGSFGIDEFLFKDPVDAYNIFRGRMSPFTATAFIAVASALIALPHARLREVARVGAGFAILLSATVLLGYFWKVGELTTDRWLPPVALNTAACFALLGVGILLSRDRSRIRLDRTIGSLSGIEIKILTAFVIAFGVLLIGGAYTYRTTVQFAGSVEWVAHSQEVRAAVASVYGSLAGAEVALRDHLLTNEEAYLDEYLRLSKDVHNRLDELQRLTIDNPTQRGNVAELRPVVAGRLEAMAATLLAFKDFGLPAARAVIAVTRRTNATQSVREKTDILDAEEMRLLAAREAATANVRSTTLISLLATLAVASGLFATLFRNVHREMRARREAEDALRASDRYSRSVIDSSPDCLCVLMLDGRVSEITPRGRRLMDLDDGGPILNTDWSMWWQGEERVAAMAALDCARAGVDGRFQAFCPTFKGVAKWWDVIVMPMLDADGAPEGLLTVARDISDVKRTEAELRESNRFLDSLIDNLPHMVVIKDAADLRVVRYNAAYAQVLGFSHDQLQGKTAEELFTPEEARFIIAKDREALDANRLVEVAEQSINTAHLGLRTFHSMKVAINDRSGAPQFLMAISTDITARKLSEQAIRELNTALEAKAAQLESSNHELESFSYSVSHDLRAPLRAIDGFALMIEEDYGDKMEEEGRRYLAVIRDNGRRMGALIDDLLAFSRLGRLPVATHEVNMDTLVREVVVEILHGGPMQPDLGMQSPPRIEVGALPPVTGDRGLLRQVWVNLISNAIKYSSKAVSPRIQVTGRRDGAEVLYSVTDNGVGFDMEYVEKLFGVFQRLHRADEFSGTGVGLAIVHRVITRHAGRVWAEGRLDEGATFSFALPQGGP